MTGGRQEEESCSRPHRSGSPGRAEKDRSSHKVQQYNIPSSGRVGDLPSLLYSTNIYYYMEIPSKRGSQRAPEHPLDLYYTT